MIYQWKNGSKAKLDAQVVGEELERLRTRHNGRLDSELVLNAAKAEASPLHAHFEWNDSAAAVAHRLSQAAYLIRSVEVVMEERPEAEPIRAFVNVVRDDDRSYTSVGHALADPDLRSQVLAQAWKELEAWHKRHVGLLELAKVFAVIEQVRPA